MGKAKHAAGGFKSKVFGSKKPHEMKHAKPQENDDIYNKYIEENFDKDGFWKKGYKSQNCIEQNDSDIYKKENLGNIDTETKEQGFADIASPEIEIDSDMHGEDEPENDYGFDALSSLSVALSTDGKFSFTRHTNKEYKKELKKEDKPLEDNSTDSNDDDNFAKALFGAMGNIGMKDDAEDSPENIDGDIKIFEPSKNKKSEQQLDDFEIEPVDDSEEPEESDVLVVDVGTLDENNHGDNVAENDSILDITQEAEKDAPVENDAAHTGDGTVNQDTDEEVVSVSDEISDVQDESVAAEENTSEVQEELSEKPDKNISVDQNDSAAVVDDAKIESALTEGAEEGDRQSLTLCDEGADEFEDIVVSIESEQIDDEGAGEDSDSTEVEDKTPEVDEKDGLISDTPNVVAEEPRPSYSEDDFDEDLSSLLSMISEIENKGKASTVPSQDEINVEDNSNQLKSSDDSDLVVAEPIDDVSSEEIRDSKEMSSKENDTIAHSLIEEPAEEASLDNNIDEPKADDSECCETEILAAYSDEVDTNVNSADENVDGTKEEAEKDENKKNKKDKKNKKPFKKQKLRYLIFAAVALVVGISIILGAVLINNEKTYGPYCKVGDHVVSKADYNFFYNSTVNNFVSTYKNYLDYIGLDLSKDFSEQQYTSDQTWQEFFQEQTLDFMKEVYALSDAGYEAGISEDNSTYETVSTNLINSAKESGVTEQEFLTQIYGSGASKKHIEKMLKMYCVAIEYSNQLKETTMVPNDEEVLKYYSTHKDDYDSVTYRVFTFEAKPTGGTKNEYGDIEYTDKEWLEAMGVANKKASNFFEQVYDESTFKALCLKYADKDEKDKYSAKNDGSLKTKQGKSAINSVLSDWLYDSARQKDATAVIEDAENHCYHIVYFIGRERDETPTVNVRHILISPDPVEKPDENATDAEKATYEAKVAEAEKSAKEKADEVYKSWLDGEKTEDSFESLAKQYSADGSNTGTYENVGRGQMVGEFDSWIFDDSRKTGDTGIVKTEYGYHIIYFVGRGEPKWKTSIKETLADKNYDTYIVNLKKNYTFEDIKGELKYLSDKEISNDLKQELGINDATPDSIKIN